MKLYSRKGDDGSTAQLGGQRVRKSDAHCEAAGTIDELAAHLGRCVQLAGGEGQEEVLGALAPAQGELFAGGSVLAAAGTGAKPGAALDAGATARLEQCIDKAMENLPALKTFILPGGCELACELHVARTVCRRAERRLMALTGAGVEAPPELLKYVNRLSDLLFALSRTANAAAGIEEQQWTCRI